MDLARNFQLSQKEAAAIERRRRFEEERKRRIFDPKCRTIGVDAYALERQVADRRARENFEHQRDLQFAIQSAQRAELASRMERQIEEAKKRSNMETNQYRMVHQRPELSREFDIWDPLKVSKDLPCRLSDDDPRCGPSSAQKFSGEDLQMKERVKYQRMQQRSWLQKQMEEDQAARCAARLRELALQNSMVAQDGLAAAAQEQHERMRRAAKQSDLNFNKLLAREQDTSRCMQNARDDVDKQMEIRNMVEGDFLTENREAAISRFGPHRVVPDRWKGMTEQQLKAIRDLQLAQAEQKRIDAAWEEAKQASIESATAANVLKSLTEEKIFSEKKAEMDKNVAEYNAALSNQQRAHNNYMEKVVFANEATEKYFNQFNTTTR